MTTSTVMTWLRDGVPITLLCDLVSLADPDSAAINRAERPNRDPIRLEVSEHAQNVAAQRERWHAASA